MWPIDRDVHVCQEEEVAKPVQEKEERIDIIVPIIFIGPGVVGKHGQEEETESCHWNVSEVVNEGKSE